MSEEQNETKAKEKPQRKNKISKKQRKVIAANAIKLLKKQFPNAFMDGSNIKPLKIGIHKDIIAMLKLMQKKPISIYACKLAVSHYASQIDYKKALSQPDAYRIDLQGKPVEKVSSIHTEVAQEKYLKLLEKEKNTSV
jgi:sRNA-binding protein